MFLQQTEGFWWSDRGEGTFEMIAAQAPDRGDAQLLRSFTHPGLKLAGDAHQHLPCFVEVGMLAGQTEDISQGRRVMASKRASGLARRTNRLHPL